MQFVKEEKQLYDYDFVVAAYFQRPHFDGFFPLLFDRLQDLRLVGCLKPLSEEFLDTYRGNIIVTTKLRTEKLSLRERHYKTIMITHGPLPVSRRSWQKPRYDYMISNGSPELLERLDHRYVGKLIVDGYFPTDYFLPERESNKVLVQVTEEQHSSLKIAEACRLLLDRGYRVQVYNHVLFKTDLSELPPEVVIIKAGIEYVHALSSCSHFVFCGTSGFITAMFTQGCRMICLGENWAYKNKKEFSRILTESCSVARDGNELVNAMEQPSKYDQGMTDYLFGTDRSPVIERIQKSLTAIAWGTI